MKSTSQSPIVGKTERLVIEPWERVLGVPERRSRFEPALVAMLTPAICWRLPLTMAYPGNYASISDWISDREDEDEVFCAHALDDGRLIGLALLSPPDDSDEGAELGYFLNESEWGRGLGTEFVCALVEWLMARGSLRLTAYTDADNIASAKVLEKSGFVRQEAASSSERFCFALARG